MKSINGECVEVSIPENDDSAKSGDGHITEFEFLKSGDQISFRLKGREDWVDEKLDSWGPTLIKTAGSLPTQNSALVPKDLETGFLTSDDEGISPDAKKFLQQHNVDWNGLDHVFHFEDGVSIIAPDIPGTSVRQKTSNVYLLKGFAEFLRTGTAKFADKDARELCRQYGVYDSPNHASSIKELKQEMIGSKSEGWTLTMPGKKRALKLIAEIVGDQVQ